MSAHNDLVEIAARILPIGQIESWEDSKRYADLAIRALTAAGYAVEQGWCDDMSKAPRDGTPVDLWISKKRNGSPAYRPCRVPEARWQGHGDDLWVAHGVAYEPFQATAWRPLPAPPAGEATDDGR